MKDISKRIASGEVEEMMDQYAQLSGGSDPSFLFTAAELLVEV